MNFPLARFALHSWVFSEAATTSKSNGRLFPTLRKRKLTSTAIPRAQNKVTVTPIPQSLFPRHFFSWFINLYVNSLMGSQVKSYWWQLGPEQLGFMEQLELKPWLLISQWWSLRKQGLQPRFVSVNQFPVFQIIVRLLIPVFWTGKSFWGRQMQCDKWALC